MLSFLCGFLLYLISLACTLFHFFSLDLKLFSASQAPAPFISPPLPHTHAALLHFSLTCNQFLSSSQTQLFWLDTSLHPSYPFYPSTIQHHTLSFLLPRGETRLKHSISLRHIHPLALCTKLTPHPHSQQLSRASCAWQSSPMRRRVLSPPAEPAAWESHSWPLASADRWGIF